MKKVLLLAVLVVACLCLSATPALAAPASAYQAPISLQPDTAYLIPNAAYWFYIDKSGNWNEYDGSTTIPDSFPMYMYFGWAFPTRGTATSLPVSMLNAITLTDDTGGNLAWSTSYPASAAQWSWVYDMGPLGPSFNKANPDYWGRDWYVELPRLADGSYTSVLTVTIAHPIVVQTYVVPLPWARHVQQTPIHFTAPWAPMQFSFTVGHVPAPNGL